MIAEGFAMFSSTRLRGRSVLRWCPINPRTTEEDIRETVARLVDRVRDQRADDVTVVVLRRQPL